MKDIKYYLQFAALMFCFLLSACSDDDDNKAPVFPDLQKIECEVGNEKTLTFEANDNWVLTSSSLWCYFEQDGEKKFTCSGGIGTNTVTIHISDEATELMKFYKAELTLLMGGSQKVIAEISRPVVGYEVSAFNEDKSVMYTDDNPFIIDFDGKKKILLVANDDWMLDEAPEWIIANKSMADGTVISGYAGEEVILNPQMIKEFLKDEKRSPLKLKNRKGEIAEIPVKYEGIPADRIVGSIDDIDNNIIKASVDGDSYTFNENTYNYEGVPVTVIARNDEYSLVCVEYTMEMSAETGWNAIWTFTLLDRSNNWFFNEDDGHGNLKIAVGNNSSEKRTAYVMAFPKEKYDQIKNSLEELVFLESGIPDGYKENLIAKVEQEGMDIREKISLIDEEGNSLTDGSGNPVKADLFTDKSEEELEAEYGTSEVYTVSSLTLGVNYNPFYIDVRDFTGWDLNVDTYHNGTDTRWTGISVEGTYNMTLNKMVVQVSGVDETKNGGTMVLKIMKGGEIIAALLIQTRYPD